MVADDPESFADLDGHNLASSWGQGPSYLKQHEEQTEADYVAQVAADNAAANNSQAQNNSVQQPALVPLAKPVPIRV